MGDGGDNDRTAALRFRYKEYSAGFNLMTEKRREQTINRDGKTIKQYETTAGWKDADLVGKNDIYQTRPSGRLGGVYVGHGNNYIGLNNDLTRHVIQNKAIHDRRFINSPHFEQVDYGNHLYGGYWPTKKFSLW